MNTESDYVRILEEERKDQKNPEMMGVTAVSSEAAVKKECELNNYQSSTSRSREPKRLPDSQHTELELRTSLSNHPIKSLRCKLFQACPCLVVPITSNEAAF